MNYLWATDVHLDHLRLPQAAFEFGRALAREQPQAQALIVTGDIAEASSIERKLCELAAGFARPVYFVLGNHDYYGGSFAAVDAAVDATTRSTQSLRWLHIHDVQLTDATTLTGVNGWYDARYGNRNSDLQLTDFVRIHELFAAQDDSHEKLLKLCADRADAQARDFEQRLETLLQRPTLLHLLVATHVPPFQAAAWHQGQPSDDHWAPFFSNKALGDVLMKCAAKHKHVNFTVLCGHTHGRGVYHAEKNLVVYTGRAQYGAPELAGFIDVDVDSIRVQLC